MRRGLEIRISRQRLGIWDSRRDFANSSLDDSLDNSFEII